MAEVPTPIDAIGYLLDRRDGPDDGDVPPALNPLLPCGERLLPRWQRRALEELAETGELPWEHLAGTGTLARPGRVKVGGERFPEVRCFLILLEWGGGVIWDGRRGVFRAPDRDVITRLLSLDIRQRLAARAYKEEQERPP